MKTFLTKVLPYVLALSLILAACAPAATPEPTAEPPVSKVLDPNYTVAAFTPEGEVEIFKGYTFEWTTSGLEHLDEFGEVHTTLEFIDYKVLCLAALNPEFGVATGGFTCRTAEQIGPDDGEVVADTYQEIFDAMNQKVIYPGALSQEGGLLAIFSDASGAPIPRASIRSDFLMLDRNTGKLYTADGIVDQFAHGAASVCIGINDGKNPNGTRECMPLKVGE